MPEVIVNAGSGSGQPVQGRRAVFSVLEEKRDRSVVPDMPRFPPICVRGLTSAMNGYALSGGRTAPRSLVSVTKPGVNDQNADQYRPNSRHGSSSAVTGVREATLKAASLLSIGTLMFPLSKP